MVIFFYCGTMLHKLLYYILHLHYHLNKVVDTLCNGKRIIKDDNDYLKPCSKTQRIMVMQDAE